MRWIGWLGLWLVSLAVGEVFVARFESKPGAVGEAAATWPSDTTIVRRPERATLVVFLHPFCPCSRATLSELERVAARCPDAADVRVLLSWDAATPPDEKSPFTDAARSLPNATVELDLGAREARRFGATTSGTAMLYDAKGRLLFEGGVTGGRGHEGENSGEQALLAALEHGVRHAGAAPVYGCPLFGATR